MTGIIVVAAFAAVFLGAILVADLWSDAYDRRMREQAEIEAHQRIEEIYDLAQRRMREEFLKQLRNKP